MSRRARHVDVGRADPTRSALWQSTLYLRRRHCKHRRPRRYAVCAAHLCLTGAHAQGGHDPLLPSLLSSRLIARRDLELGTQLGHGAFGVVHRGRLLRTGVDVAVKVLDVAHVVNSIPGFTHQDTVRAFYWEAINLALCDHPGIVELLGVCVDPATNFRAIVLEFCGGGDLKCALRAPPADVWRWAVQLAEALHYLHASGQVHRDIKGENVLLSGDRRVAKFADLGVADADEEFVGDKLGAVRGFSQKDVRWAAPEELTVMQADVRRRAPRHAARWLTACPWRVAVRRPRGPGRPTTTTVQSARATCRRPPPTCSVLAWCCISCAAATARHGGPPT